MTKQSVKTKEMLERQGASYVEALLALRDFRKEVLRRSKSVLGGKIDKVSRAVGAKCFRRYIGYFVFPSLEPKAGREVGLPTLLADLWLSSDCTVYAGLEWRYKGKTKKVEVLAVVGIWTTRYKFRRYWEEVRTSARDLRTDMNHRLFLQEACAPNEIANFQVKLEQMVDRWCDIWGETGGIATLTRRS